MCVVAGFQGVSTDKEITTLGRGGSDTTAVALAAALGADACEIYTDVTGVFIADPRIVPQARKLAHVNFDEMLEMAGAGSKVLALRIGRVRPQPQRPASTSAPASPGSRARGSPSRSQAWKTRSSPASSPTSARPRSPSSACPTGPASRRRCSSRSRRRNVNVDMIVQNTSTDGTHRHQLHDAEGRHGASPSRSSMRVAREIGAEGVNHDADIAKISRSSVPA